MEKPLVTIAITAYNGAKFIHWPLESSIHQTYSNLDILILDDASTDETGLIAKHYAEIDKRVRYVRNEDNIGYARSLLKMAELAKGEYLQLLGADDWLSKNYIETTLNKLEKNPKAACVASEILTLRTMEGGYFEFQDSFLPRKGAITKNLYVRRVYKSALATLTAFALFRTSDFLESSKFMNTAFANPPIRIPEELQKLHFKGFATEALFLLSSIWKYEYFIVTGDAVYIKTQHFENENKPYAKSVDWVSAGRILRWYFYSRLAYEYVFRENFRKYFPGLRLFFGADPFVSITIVYLRKGFIKKFFDDFNLREVKSYFSGYSVLEIIVSLLWIPVRSAIRLFLHVTGISDFFGGRKIKKDVSRPEFFLDQKNRFESKGE